MEETWISKAEAAQLAGVSVRTMNRWKTEGRVPWRWAERGGQMVPVFSREGLPKRRRRRDETPPEGT